MTYNPDKELLSKRMIPIPFSIISTYDEKDIISYIEKEVKSICDVYVTIYHVPEEKGGTILNEHYELRSNQTITQSSWSIVTLFTMGIISALHYVETEFDS